MERHCMPGTRPRTYVIYLIYSSYYSPGFTDKEQGS